MGQEIVRQESSKDPGERSRLRCRDDIIHVLQENKGTSKIEMIYLNCPPMEPIDMNEKAFKKMTKLKTLIIEKGHFSKCPKYLPSSLRVLEWKGFSSGSLSSCFSNKKKFNNIKILTLDFSEYLTYIPDVSGLPNLEKLSFQDCHSLITIHNSVGYLNKLEILNAICCSNLESFPSLQLPSLKELGLNECSSLKNFPKLLCKMANIKEIVICDTYIEDLPCSFGNLTELCRLVIISDNFKILPECLSECHHLVDIDVDYCMSLEEIRGIPPNLKELSAIECESLSSSSRRMLLSQKLHEAGGTFFHFSNGTEGIPDWFEHQMSGDTFSFWFRKKIPSLTCIIVIPAYADLLEFNLFLNDNEITLPDICLNHEDGLTMGHAFLFDLILDQCINKSFERKPELYEAFRNNEWNHVQLNWKIIDESDSEEYYLSDTEEEEDHVSDTEEEDHVSDMEEGEKEIKILRSDAQMGIHVSWEGDDFSDTEEKSNKEGDVRFTNPYSKRKKFRRMPKKQREEILHRLSIEKTKSEEGKSLEVSETENLQQQDLAFLSSDMHNLVLTETKEEHRFVEVGVSETESLEQQYLAIVSGMRNLVLTEIKEEDRFVEVGVSETESLQQQQQHLALLSLQQQMALLPQQQRITVLSGMWNLVLSETKEKEHHV